MKDNRLKKATEIQHLSHDEIEQLYQRYIQGEKNSILLEEYKINIHPNNLIKLFPPQILDDIFCPYCEIQMFQKRRSKSSIKYAPPVIRCFQCEHKIFPGEHSTHFQLCDCKTCLTTRELERRDVEEKRRNIIRKEFSLTDRKPVKYSELNFFQKLILLTLLRMHTDENFSYIFSLDDLSKVEILSPTNQMDIDCLKSLFDAKIIVVDPESVLEAFLEVEENSFNLRKTRWIPNVTLDKYERASLRELYNEINNELKDGVQSQCESDIFRTIYKIATEEVLQYIHVKADELYVYFTAEKKTREVVEELLHSFSVSEIYYFVKKSIEDAHIFYSKGYAKNKNHAANIIPKKMLSLGERATNEGWEPYKYSRDSRAPRSYLSQLFYDFFLQDEDSGFTKAPGKYWKNELCPKYFSEQVASKKGAVQCIECGSFDVSVKMVDIVLQVNCMRCGFINSFTSDNNNQLK